MQTRDLLASLGSPVSIEDMTDYIVRSLNDAYRAVIDGVNARDNSTTFDNLLKKLLIQELSITVVQQKTPAQLTALSAQARPNYNNNKPRPAQLLGQSNQRPGNCKPFFGKCQWCNVNHMLWMFCVFPRLSHMLTINLYYVGYSADQHAYLCLDPTTGKIYTSHLAKPKQAHSNHSKSRNLNPK